MHEETDLVKLGEHSGFGQAITDQKKTTSSAVLSRKVNKIQTSECTNNEMSSSCERYSRLLRFIFVATVFGLNDALID